jgi:hypothetical protein
MDLVLYKQALGKDVTHLLNKHFELPEKRQVLNLDFLPEE